MAHLDNALDALTAHQDFLSRYLSKERRCKNYPKSSGRSCFVDSPPDYDHWCLPCLAARASQADIDNGVFDARSHIFRRASRSAASMPKPEPEGGRIVRREDWVQIIDADTDVVVMVEEQAFFRRWWARQWLDNLPGSQRHRHFEIKTATPEQAKECERAYMAEIDRLPQSDPHLQTR